MPKVSAIMVNYNASHVLAEAVTSLLASPSISKLFVVDNDSRDNSMKHLESVCASDSRLICIRNNKNLGFARACNIGIAADGESDYLLFLNPDCILEKNALEKLLDCLQAHPESGMVGPLLLNSDGTEQPGGRRSIPTPWRSFIHSSGLSKLSDHYPDMFSDFLLYKKPLPDHPIEIEAISGSCMLVKRKAMMDVGVLDVGYFLHCEDLDWCMRFSEKGWKIMFVPEARAVHYKGICSRTRPVFVEWHKHKGMIRFYNKYFRHKYPVLLLFIIDAAIWFRFVAVSFYRSATTVMQRLGRGAA